MSVASIIKKRTNSETENEKKANKKVKHSIEPSADAQVISVANLSLMHSESTDYVLELKLIDKKEMFYRDTSNGPKKTFSIIFEDSVGTPILMNCWGEIDDSDQFCQRVYDFLKEGKCYRFCNFTVKTSKDFDKRFCKTNYMILAKGPNEENIGGLHVFALKESITSGSAAANALKQLKFVENIASLPKLFIESDEKAKTPNYNKTTLALNTAVNVVGVIVDYQEPQTKISKNGKEYTLCKLLIADDSNASISIIIWGTPNVELQVGNLVTFTNATLNFNPTGKNYDLQGGKLSVIDCNTLSAGNASIHPNARVAIMQRWKRTAELDTAKYQNFSNYNPNGVDSSFVSSEAPINNRVTCAQLKSWRAEAKGMIQTARANNLIPPDQFKLPKELEDQLPKGTFSILGEIQNVVAPTFSATANANSIPQSLIRPCCPNPVHGVFKTNVEYQSQQGQWYCANAKCKQHYDTCIYGIRAILKIADFTDSVECNTFTLDGIVPEEMASAENLLLACKNIKCRVPGAEQTAFTVSELLPGDCQYLNDLVVQSIDDYVTKQNSMFAFTISVKPDFNEGLSINVNHARVPNFAQENVLLTNQIETQN